MDGGGTQAVCVVEIFLFVAPRMKDTRYRANVEESACVHYLLVVVVPVPEVLGNIAERVEQ